MISYAFTMNLNGSDKTGPQQSPNNERELIKISYYND